MTSSNPVPIFGVAGALAFGANVSSAAPLTFATKTSTTATAKVVNGFELVISDLRWIALLCDRPPHIGFVRIFLCYYR